MFLSSRQFFASNTNNCASEAKFLRTFFFLCHKPLNKIIKMQTQKCTIYVLTNNPILCLAAILAARSTAKHITGCQAIFTARLSDRRQNSDCRISNRWKSSSSTFVGGTVDRHSKVQTCRILSIS